MKALFTLALLFIACLSYSQQQLLDSVEYIYWGDYTDGTIRKAKLDGSDIDTIVDDDSKIRRIRLDRRDRKIYWASGYYGAIRSANYDGSDISTVLQTSLDIDLIEVDQKNKKIYFTEDYTGTIKRCNTDGTELETIITGTGLVLGMAIDTVRDILFYGDYTNKKIFKANTDGTNIVEIHNSNLKIYDLYIDVVGKPDEQDRWRLLGEIYFYFLPTHGKTIFANAQMAHLVFPTHKPNAKNQKSHFLPTLC